MIRGKIEITKSDIRPQLKLLFTDGIRCQAPYVCQLTDLAYEKMPRRPFQFYLIELHSLHNPADIVLHLCNGLELQSYPHQRIDFSEMRTKIHFQKDYFFVDSSSDERFNCRDLADFFIAIEVIEGFKEKNPDFCLTLYWRYI